MLMRGKKQFHSNENPTRFQGVLSVTSSSVLSKVNG